MKIGKINQQPSFKRVVKLQTNAPHLKESEKKQAVKELSNVLDNKNSNIYTMIQQNDLKTFFHMALTDVKDEKILVRQNNGNDYVISGKEAEEISRLEDLITTEKDLINTYNLITSKDIIEKSQKQIDNIIKNADENGLEKNENGFRPNSVIELNFRRPVLGIDDLLYFTFTQKDKKLQSEKIALSLKNRNISIETNSEDM